MIKGRPIQKPTKTNSIGMNQWVSQELQARPRK